MANTFGLGVQLTPEEKERYDNHDAEEARLKARLAGRHALAAKIRWETIEKQWLATNEAYTNQANRYETMTGILATQDWNNNGINGPQPQKPHESADRPLSIMTPDPDAGSNTYPAIRRGHWTHGDFPVDNSFGQTKFVKEPETHSGFHRSSDKVNDRRLYQPGTIISTMWHQDYAFDTLWKERDKYCLTLNRQLGVIYSKRRKFVIVARFKEDYIALPIWTSYAEKLKHDRYRDQRIEFMEILHQGDSIAAADKMNRQTPYDYLFQREKRRQPNVTGLQTSAEGWQRHLEEDWLDMKRDGAALLRLTYPVPMDYRVKCQIIGSLQPTSVEYLLKTWTTVMHQSSLGHLIGAYENHQNIPSVSRARKTDEATKAVDNLIKHLKQQLNIVSESNSLEVWNTVSGSRKDRLESRKTPLADSLEKLASALEASETLVSEAMFHGAIYDTIVDTVRLLQEARGFLQLLAKVVVDPNCGGGITSLPGSPNGRSIGVNSPLPSNPFQDRFGEARYVAPGSALKLSDAQHTQLGHATYNPNQTPTFQQPESSKKRKTIG